MPIASPEHGRRGLRRLLHPAGSDEPPLSSTSPPFAPRAAARPKNFASAALRGLGCTSSAASQAYAPAAAAVRSSADWHGGRRRRKERRKDRNGHAAGTSAAGGGDLWCAPVMPFAADASVDCVVAHQAVNRGHHRERACMGRRVTVQEEIPPPSFMDSPPRLIDPSFFEDDFVSSGRLRRMRGYRHSPERIEEEVIRFRFHTRVAMMYDRFKDWRLDIDRMTYEELLALGDRIGYVNNGLREEEIARSLKKVKHVAFDSSLHHSEIERKCSICQEEYEPNEELGKLGCGHSHHMYCIKQWLSQKNACPVCKTAISKTKTKSKSKT